MTNQELIDDLWNDAQKNAQALGLELAGDDADSLLDFIRDGVKRLELDGALDNPNKIADAKTNLAMFIDGMAHQTQIQEFGVQKSVFDSVKGALCPLYPFC